MTDLLKLTTDERGVATLTLSRPDVHNAFNAKLIEQLMATFEDIAESDQIRVLILTGAGRSFSAGADVNWMRAMAEGSEQENRADARKLASMLRALDQLPCPTIARVNGSAFGGGVGLIACCDMAVAVNSAKFGLTEVRLGLAPATIAPFVIGKIGAGASRRYMLTGERFDSASGLGMGLLNAVVEPEQLDLSVDHLVDHLLAGGENAQGHVKALIQLVEDHQDAPDALDRKTSEMIAALRVSREGQEGLKAFLEKRDPVWNKGSEKNE